MVCMDCGIDDTLDFCDKPACMACTIKTCEQISSPHLPTHDFVKVRTPIMNSRDIGRILRNAKAGLERAKHLLKKVDNQTRGDREGGTAVVDEREDRGDSRDRKGGEAHESREDHDGGEDHEDGSGEDREDGGDGAGQAALSANEVVLASRDATASSHWESKVTTPGLACLRCGAPITQPCFYCIECPGALSVNCRDNIWLTKTQKNLQPLFVWIATRGRVVLVMENITLQGTILFDARRRRLRKSRNGIGRKSGLTLSSTS